MKKQKQPEPKKLTEQEFVDTFLSGKTWGWEELLSCGWADVDQLEDGDLKKAIKKYEDSHSAVWKRLQELNYEAG